MLRAANEVKTPRFVRCVRAFEEEFDFLYRLLRRQGVPDSDVEDVVQEVFAVLWRRWDDFQEDRPLRPWLAGIAIRRAYKYLGRRRREVAINDLDVRDAATDGLDDRTAARALLQQALAEVPELNRSAMVLYELDGLTMPEVAEALAIPLATAYTRVGRGRRAFVAAVRSLETGPRRNLRGALAPTTLFELGREPLAAPAGMGRRALERASTLEQAPLPEHLEKDLEIEAAAPTRGPGGALVRPLAWGAAAVGLAALVGLALLPGRTPRTVSTPPTEAVPATRLPRLERRPQAWIAPAVTASASATGLAPQPEPGAMAAALARGLTGYWRFDEGSGSAAAHDLSGGGSDCYLRNMDTGRAWADGQMDGALRLGMGGWVSCAQPGSAAGAPADLTVAVWMKRAKYGKWSQTLVARQLEGTKAHYFQLGILRDQLLLGSDVWNTKLKRALPPIADGWAHVAFTHARDGATKLYLAGVEVDGAQGLAAPGEAGVLIPRLHVGFSAHPQRNNSTARFNGQLDELVVYDRVLPAAEVAALAAGTQPAR